MKKLRRIYLVALVIIGMVVLSCAETQEAAYPNMEADSFNAWMAKYNPQATALESGAYIEYHSRADNWESLYEPELDSCWFRIGYTGYTTNYDIFVSRYDSLGLQLGTWNYTTHYVDDYLIFSEYNTRLCPAFWELFSYLRAGDSVTVYIPAADAYTSSYYIDPNGAYLNGVVSYSGYPNIFNLKVSEINTLPYDREIEKLNQWVADNWGMSESDTLVEGVYYRILESNPEGDSVCVDSTVSMWRTTYFLEDGQLVNTNVQDTAIYYGYYSADSVYVAENVTGSVPLDAEDAYSDGTDVTSYYVYEIVAPKMRKGEKAEIVASSIYTHGAAGSTSFIPEILPYQSQRLIIEIEDDEEEEDEDDEDDE